LLTAIKIRSTLSFGWEVKPSAPCRKIFRHVTIHLFEQKYFARPWVKPTSPLICSCITGLKSNVFLHSPWTQSLV
jgi:hypothetical protein